MLLEETRFPGRDEFTEGKDAGISLQELILGLGSGDKATRDDVKKLKTLLKPPTKTSCGSEGI